MRRIANFVHVFCPYEIRSFLKSRVDLLQRFRSCKVLSKSQSSFSKIWNIKTVFFLFDSRMLLSSICESLRSLAHSNGVNSCELTRLLYGLWENQAVYEITRPVSPLQARREATGGPGQSGHPEGRPTFRLWSMRQKEFHSGLRSLRHFEEFLGILRNKAFTIWGPQSTRPWGILPPLPPPSLRASSVIPRFNNWHRSLSFYAKGKQIFIHWLFLHPWVTLKGPLIFFCSLKINSPEYLPED